MRAFLDCDGEMETDFCPDCGTETEEVMVCDSCGQEQLNSGYCIACGEDLEED